MLRVLCARRGRFEDRKAGIPMSDKPKKEEPKGDDHGEKKKKGGIKALLTKLPVLLGGVMVIEAIVIFGVMKMMGGKPEPVAGADGAELHADDAHGGGHDDGHGGKGKDGEKKVDPNSKSELMVIEMRAPNKLSGRTFLYDVAIFVSVKQLNEEKVKTILEQRKALISDRVRTIIAQSEPSKLDGAKEPGLETLRRQVKYQLDEIVGAGLIEEVLVPRCIPYRADF